MLTAACENRTNVFSARFLLFPLLFITCYSFSQSSDTIPLKDSLTKSSRFDTLRRPGLRTYAVDTTQAMRVDTFNLSVSSDSLSAPVVYEAQDSGVLDIPSSKFYLYGKAHTTYETLDLKAGQIEIDNSTGIAKAYFTRDSAGKVLDRPVLVDGDLTSESDSMFYNFKTQRGLTKSTYTKQGEMFVYAERIKKVSAESFFASRGRFTTCNLDTPHFAFRSPKMKLVSNKWAYSGLAYPEFEGVPLPIGLPFGIYPLSQGRHSGLLAPTITTVQSFGLGLEGLGFYKVINDYFDVMVRTNIYSYGGFNIMVAPTYRVLYKYNGSLRFNFQNTRINFKGDPDFRNNKSFSVGWSHQMDSKARPGTNFGANVDFSSVPYNRSQPNNPGLNFKNTNISSISYSKTWGDGKYHLGVTASHRQNNQLGQYDIELPSLNFTMNTLYPFQQKEAVGAAKWYEKLGIGYNGQALNRVTFFDRDTPYLKYNIGEILDTMQWGAKHNLPINLSLPSLGPLTLAPFFGYSEHWYGQRRFLQWNDVAEKVDTTINKGFYTSREINFGVSAQTAVFGTFNFKGDGRIKALRHVIRPTAAISYRPNLARREYYTARINKDSATDRFSYYEGGVFKPFSEGKFGGMTFGLQNNLEMKVRSKKDTTAGATEKIRLIDNLNISSGYNFLDSVFKISPIQIVASSNLFEIINITASAQIDPYLEDSTGKRVNRLVWADNPGRLGRFTGGTISGSASFQSKQTKEEEDEPEEDNQLFVTPDEMMRQQEYIRNNPAEFADFNVPWSLQVGYSLTFQRTRKPDFTGYRTELISSINLNGDFNLTPRWKLGSSLSYDVNTNRIGLLTMFLSRELHCWQMSLNITPVGYYRSFSINISPRSGILRDLKINRSRNFPG